MTGNETASYEISRAWSAAQAVIRFVSFPFVDFFFKILNRARAIGRENIPASGGVVIASNHVSGVDTLLIPAFATRRWDTMPFMAPAKEELFRYPVMAQILRAWGAFPVKRRARDFDAMRRMAYCAGRYHVMLFPEGTRTKTGALGRGRAGAGWVIHAARPVVIPTLVINTDRFFWPGRRRPWFGVPYTVVFGEPLDLSRHYAMPESKETSQAIVDEIMAAIASLKERHRDLYLP